MYPREEHEGGEHKLIYYCKSGRCPQVETDDFCVYNNDLQAAATIEEAPADIVDDMCLPRTIDTCQKCQVRGQIVYFAARSRGGKQQDNMQLTFVCTNEGCGYTWIE